MPLRSLNQNSLLQNLPTPTTVKYEQNAFIIIKMKFPKIIENEHFEMYYQSD